LDLGWSGDADNAEGTFQSDYETDPTMHPVFSTHNKHCACFEFLQLRPTVIDDHSLVFGTAELRWTKRATNGDPLDRFRTRGWDPAGFGALRLHALPAMNPARVIAEQAPPSAPGGRALRSEEKVERQSEAIRAALADTPTNAGSPPDTMTTSTPSRTVAYRSTPLLESRPVLDLDCGAFPHRDPLCLGGSRWIPWAGYDASSSKSTEGLALYFYPHALPWLGDIASTLGYRFEGRYDVVRKREHTGIESDRQHAWAGEASFVYQPGSRRLTDMWTVSPYSMLGPGVLHLNDGMTALQIQRGLGIENRIGWTDVQVEYRHTYYFGKVAENTVYSLGFLIHQP
jgi:hypothetical protein